VTASDTHHNHSLDVNADTVASVSDITSELQAMIRQWADVGIRRSEIMKLVALHLSEDVLSSVVKTKVIRFSLFLQVATYHAHVHARTRMHKLTH
jgi:hypothetical protein